MKKILLTTGFALVSLCLQAQGVPYDPNAIFILDRMSDVIGDLKACSYKLTIAVDVNDFDHGMIKQYGVSEVFMVGPDKLLVDSRNHKGHRTFAYNGSQMAYYSHDENNFGIVPAPPTILETIDSFHEDYGIEFPAADFFYPTFTDDLMASNEQIRLLGKVVVDGAECFHILAKGKEMNVQIWISNDAFTLPKMLVITYAKEGSPQYEARFSGWQVNPDLPSAMFEFLPPAGAAEVRLLPKTNK